MSSARYRRIMSLWRQNSCCHWCGCQTIVVFRPPKIFGLPLLKFQPVPFEATIDHLYSRFDGRRRQTWGEETTVLACWRCNNQRARVEQEQRPIVELQRLARKHKRRLTLAEYDHTHDNGCSICRDPNCTEPGGQH